MSWYPHILLASHSQVLLDNDDVRQLIVIKLIVGPPTLDHPLYKPLKTTTIPHCKANRVEEECRRKMEAYKRFVILALVLVVAVVANGQGSICRMTQDGLTACKPSVSGQSPLPPSPACCAAISKADLPCLCSFKNSALLPYLGIDPNMATQLPAKCNIVTSTHCWNLAWMNNLFVELSFDFVFRMLFFFLYVLCCFYFAFVACVPYVLYYRVILQVRWLHKCYCLVS